MSVGWKCIDYGFKFLCALVTFILVGYCCYNYFLDEDETLVSFKQFDKRPEDILPSFSVCITSPYEESKLKKYGPNVTGNAYSAFLSGDIWQENLHGIEYDDIALKPKEYVTGYSTFYFDTTFDNKTYEAVETEKQEELNTLVQPTTRLKMSNLMCLGIDFPIERSVKILGRGIKIKTSIFKDGIRSGFMHALSKDRGFAIMIHYPHQIFRNRWWKSNWPARPLNASKSYVITYDIRGMEVVRYRDKRGQRCQEEFPEYDDQATQDILLSVGCKPPYIHAKNNLTACTTLQQMKEITERQIQLWSEDNPKYLPCNGLERISYEVTESDEPEGKEPYFLVFLMFKELTYKEIKLKKAYDFQVLVGNVGGLIGLFLGYALMMIPESIKFVFIHVFYKRNDTSSSDCHQIENNALNKGDSSKVQNEGNSMNL